MNKTLIVAKREFTKVVKKPSFWITTLAFPILFGVITIITGFAGMQVENTVRDNQKSLQNIVIQDNSGLINENLVKQIGYTFTKNKDETIQKVINNEISALIYYPADILDSKKIEIFAKDLGIFGNEAFSNIAKELLKNSAIADIRNPLLIQAFHTELTPQSTFFKDGEEVEYGLEKFIVPIIAVAIYFILSTLATSYLLMSVSEEKENRAIEIVLSAIKTRELIFGKIIGLIGVILTQVILLGSLSLLVFILLQSSITIPIDISSINISIGQVLSAFFYSFLSFFIIACTMVGVGAAMPNYKEANSFSAIFIVASVIPLYFVTTIIANPSGELSVILSYLPFTSGLVLLFRSTTGAMQPIEIVISGILLIIYAVIALFMAFKLFEFGSLEYGRKISFKDFFKNLTKKN